ncbi:alpha/beta fold hydrolase [Nocardiopsis sp. JB363]|uniref:alpha/beta fold hydrolase n=1 Tax=Nocardiopsis sp. JB363 TaxID=1434837 RepID=UPI00097AECB0|nr:alpha/beta hydrolase [Nocardiopsis sp. JB363]SIO88378.1 N-formylglutamate deformylase [Nocardiopsis sp. JB363]
MTGTRTLKTPDGVLYYEVHGEGPLLILTGAPMGADMFGPLAEALAETHTVVTHDPRGIGRSVLDDPDQDSTPEARADDLVALLDHMGIAEADFLGSSGGAVTTLALAEHHPDRARVIVAHEPPLLGLLPEAEEQFAVTEEIIATYHRDGAGAAWRRFMANAGFPTPEEDSEGSDANPAEEEGDPNDHRFYVHELRGTVHHRVDIERIAAGSARVVPALGATSGGLITDRTTRALAELLGVVPVVFPGDHGGFVEDPNGFAGVLRETLASVTESGRRPTP